MSGSAKNKSIAIIMGTVFENIQSNGYNIINFENGEVIKMLIYCSY